MTPRAKRLAALMRGSDDKGDDYESEPNEGESSDKAALAREVYDAVKADDPDGFATALHEYVLACIEKGDDEKPTKKAKLLIGVG